MLRLLAIAIFFELHLSFFCGYFLFAWDSHESQWAVSTYWYGQNAAIKATIYSFLCFATLLAGLYIRQRPNSIMLPIKINFKRVAFLYRTLTILFIPYFLYLMATAYGENYGILVSSQHSFAINSRIVIDSLLCILLFNGFKFKKIDIFLTIINGIIVVFLGSRSNMVRFIFIFLLYYIVKYELEGKNKAKAAVMAFVFITLLMIFVNVVSVFRQGHKIENNERYYRNALSSEYRMFAPSIVSEVVSREEEPRLWGKTFARTIPLLIPSVIRNQIGIHLSTSDRKESVYDNDSDIAIFSDIGRTAIRQYGGGFSSVAELFLNFWYLGCIGMFGVGWLLSRELELLKIALKKKEMASVYAVYPILFSVIHIGYRNDIAVTLKMIVQLYIIVFVLMRVCSRGWTRMVLRPKPGLMPPNYRYHLANRMSFDCDIRANGNSKTTI